MADIFKTIFNTSMLKLGKRIERRQFNALPIVIGASPRSGTTILLSILGAHPAIFAIPDQTYAFDIWQSKQDENTEGNSVYPLRIDRVYRELVLNRIPKTTHRWCEKTPKNIQYFDKILNYFSDQVRLIHIVRDGRDVIVSKHPKHNPDTYWVPVERWVNDVAFGARFENHPSVLTLRYEDLVQKYDSSIAQICQFLDEPIDQALNNWISYTNVRKSKHLHKPVENLFQKSIGKWKDKVHENRIKEIMQHEKAVELLKHFKYIKS